MYAEYAQYSGLCVHPSSYSCENLTGTGLSVPLCVARPDDCVPSSCDSSTAVPAPGWLDDSDNSDAECLKPVSVCSRQEKEMVCTERGRAVFGRRFNDCCL